ncbi:MAG TPA: HD domain-containing protein [Planctomycetaceae bacterium]|nr:HD domain-containing protein [Planctomycetaceae bacterium]
MSNPFRSIPELQALERAGGLVRIPMEQDVPLTPRVRSLVDTPEFQRLSRISQLGLAARVYPGATHTRFEHSLGVYHNALLYLRQLSQDRRFVKSVDPHEAEVLIAASLLHDIGHWPFCHPIEDMGLTDLPDHEEFAEEYLSPAGCLGSRLRSEWKIEPREVLDLLAGRFEKPSQKLVYSILSGPIDIDKMDYLYRDSLHAGVPYGRNFDRNRLIGSLIVNENGDGLAINSKGRTAAELMVFARYVMFGEVYWHHAVRSATSMFTRAFHAVRRELDLRELFRLDERDFVDQLSERLEGRPEQQLLDGVFGAERRLYKRIAEFSFFQSPEIYSLLARKSYEFLVKCSGALAEVLSEKLDREIRPRDVIIDAPPARREVEFRVQIHFTREDVYRPLQEVSPVVDAMARTQFDDSVKRVRLFVAPEHRDAIEQLTDINKLLPLAYERAQGNLFPSA